jgi:putative polyhydroxyalkanoate system protein
MSEIQVTRAHGLPPDEARRRVEQVVDELRGKHSISSEWESDTRMSISAMGVTGAIELRPDEIAVTVEKSFWVPISDEQLEATIVRALDKGLA